MQNTLQRCLTFAKSACINNAALDDSIYSRVLQQLLTAYSHAMRLVNKHSEEQAASDALLPTAIKEIALDADYIMSEAVTAQPARQQLVVTCIGESGVSGCATAACQSHDAVVSHTILKEGNGATKRSRPRSPVVYRLHVYHCSQPPIQQLLLYASTAVLPLQRSPHCTWATCTSDCSQGSCQQWLRCSAGFAVQCCCRSLL
jgi:hypothetical protein